MHLRRLARPVLLLALRLRAATVPSGALLTLTLLAGCRGGAATGGGQAGTYEPEAKPRSYALQHEYVASPQAHFDQMAAESIEQQAQAKAEAEVKAAKTGKGRTKGQPARAAAAPAAGFPAPQTAPPAAGFPVPNSPPPSAGFPPPASSPPPVSVPPPAAAPVARSANEPNPCIGGDPCIQRTADGSWSRPGADVAVGGDPRATR